MGDLERVLADLRDNTARSPTEALGVLYGAVLALLEHQHRSRERAREVAQRASRLVQQEARLGRDLDGTLESARVVAVQGQPWQPAQLGLGEAGALAAWNGAQWVASPVGSALPPLTRTRFVDAGTALPPKKQTGQEWAPYATEQPAFDEIAEAPQGTDWAVVIRRPSGKGFTVPARRRVVVRAEFRGAQLGAIRWEIGGANAESVLNLKDLACGKITVEDESPTSFAILALESVICGGVDNLSTGSTSTLHVLSSGPVPTYLRTATSTSAQFSGPVAITGLAALLHCETQTGVTLTAGGLLALGCGFGGDVTVTGGGAVELASVLWTYNAPSLTFVGAPGVVLADSLSTQNARRSNLFVANGRLAPFVETQIGPYNVAAPIEGGLYYDAGGNAALAQANSDTSSRVLGAWANLDGHLVRGRIVPVLFPPGLGIVGGEPVYLSPTQPGHATTDRPVLAGEKIAPIGQVHDPYLYSPLTGGLVQVLVQPGIHQSVDSEGGEVVLAQLDTAGVWFPDEWIGPSSGATSTPTPDAPFGFGCGFWVAPFPGRLRGFRLTNATFSGSDLAFEVWVAPPPNAGDPVLFSYSGVTVPIPAKSYSVVDYQSVPVAAGDLVGIRNASGLVGYTSGGLRVSSRYLVD